MRHSHNTVRNYSIGHFDLGIVSHWEAPVLFFDGEILQKGKIQKIIDFEGFWLLEVRK